MQFMINLGVQEISLMLIALSFIHAWIEIRKHVDKVIELKTKPFFCDACLSWWVGCLLVIITQNPIFFILYMCNSIYNRIKL